MSPLDPLDPTHFPTTREGVIAQKLKTVERRLAVIERKSINALSIPVGSLIARPASAVPTGGPSVADSGAASASNTGAASASNSGSAHGGYKTAYVFIKT